MGKFTKERDEALASGDVDRVLAFWRKYNPHMREPSSRLVAEMAMHKARTAATTLPMEVRQASKQWLQERGYKAWDDGDVVT
jgi:hypothetical protein